jgi:uncharacterized protein DUF4331
MSSHREAPEISKDPVADSTDVYAFVSPDRADTVTLIANYIPLQGPAGGPNFYEFGDDVLYGIHIDNDGDGRADISYEFRFHTRLRDRDTFLYNTGPIGSLDSPNWNRRQFYTLTRVRHGKREVLGHDLACPPCNIGPLSTPDYGGLAAAAVHGLPGGARVFAGQRAEGFYVDLGSIFDLANLRPFQQLHNQYGMNVFTKPAPGVNATAALNVHSIAIQVPISQVTRGGSGNPGSPRSVIGVWTTAGRQRVRLWDADGGENLNSGPFHQVSRLGNPLVNEVLIPLGKKDLWNSLRSSLPARQGPTWRRSCSPGYPRESSRASRTTRARCSRTCCGSTPPSRRAASRTSSASSAATSPDSPTAAGYSTTWSPSSCGPSPGSPTRWSTRGSRPTPRPAWSPTG